MSGDDVRFVEGDPESYIVSKCTCNLFGIAGEVFRKLWREHPALLSEPEGQCPMPEGDEWLDVSRSERADNCLVMDYFFLIPHSFLRLDARPLDGESGGGVTEFFGNIEVFFIAMIVIDSDSGNIVLGARGFRAELLGPAGEVPEFRSGFLGEAAGILRFPP